MQLEELTASVRQLVDLLQSEPEPNPGSLGRALLLLMDFISDPLATAEDRLNEGLVEAGIMAWFESDWQQKLGPDSSKARMKLVSDIARLVAPFRDRLR